MGVPGVADGRESARRSCRSKLEPRPRLARHRSGGLPGRAGRGGRRRRSPPGRRCQARLGRRRRRRLVKSWFSLHGGRRPCRNQAFSRRWYGRVSSGRLSSSVKSRASRSSPQAATRRRRGGSCRLADLRLRQHGARRSSRGAAAVVQGQSAGRSPGPGRSPGQSWRVAGRQEAPEADAQPARGRFHARSRSADRLTRRRFRRK